MGKVIKILLIIIAILLIAFAGYKIYNDNYLYAKAPTIEYSTILEQEDSSNGYIVYFYQKTCEYCLELLPDITEWYKANASDIPIYLVDMTLEENKDAWLDWDEYHKANDIVIGKYDDEGNQIYNDGLTQEQIDEKYPSDVYTIEQSASNPEEIVAFINPQTTVDQITEYQDVVISGTPTLIYVKDGEVLNFTKGLDGSTALLNSLSGN